MTNWRTIRIPEDDFEQHQDRKEQLGLTWAEYLDGKAPDTIWQSGGEIEIESLKDPDYDHLREIVREETRQAIEEARQ